MARHRTGRAAMVVHLPWKEALVVHVDLLLLGDDGGDGDGGGCVDLGGQAGAVE